jgi:hypothetical protein
VDGARRWLPNNGILNLPQLVPKGSELGFDRLDALCHPREAHNLGHVPAGRGGLDLVHQSSQRMFGLHLRNKTDRLTIIKSFGLFCYVISIIIYVDDIMLSFESE